MTKKQKSANLNVDELLPAVDSFTSDREEYIRALEMSVQLLQREVEHLRSQKNTGEKEDQEKEDESSPSRETINLYKYSLNDREIISRIKDQISENYSVLESDLFYFSSGKNLIAASDTDLSPKFREYVKKFEEEGIIDWAIENEDVTIIPNLSDEEGLNMIYFILTPLFLRGNAIGIFIAKTGREKDTFSDDEKERIKMLMEYAAIALDNIRSSEEIARMNRKLNALNNQMMRSSRLASIGEISASIANEIENPLQLILGHLNLIETGVGDTPRRLEIIKDEIYKINEITKHLSDLSHKPYNDKSPKRIQICQLIEEVLLFSAYQLQRDGIKVEKEFEDIEITIRGFQSEIEQVILSLILFSRDMMPDGGNITIAAFRSDTGNVHLSLADTSRGMSKEKIIRLFDPYARDSESEDIHDSSLYIVKNIIEDNGGKITVYSEEDKGTTFKIVFPYREETSDE